MSGVSEQQSIQNMDMSVVPYLHLNMFIYHLIRVLKTIRNSSDSLKNPYVSSLASFEQTTGGLRSPSVKDQCLYINDDAFPAAGCDISDRCYLTFTTIQASIKVYLTVLYVVLEFLANLN